MRLLQSRLLLLLRPLPTNHPRLLHRRATAVDMAKHEQVPTETKWVSGRCPPPHRQLATQNFHQPQPQMVVRHPCQIVISTNAIVVAITDDQKMFLGDENQ
jgi:hypothetical protein